MKRILSILSAMSLLIFAGCQKTGIVEMNQDVVKFRTMVSSPTKAAATTTGSLETFEAAAFAYDGTEATTAYMPVTTFDKQSDGSFTSETSYYWPQEGKLNFYAYSPAAAAGSQVVAGATCKTFTVTPSAEFDEQIDFIYANTNEKGKDDASTTGGIAINFRHTESQIAVMVKNSNSGIKFVVDDWKVAYVAKSGVFTYNAAVPEGQTGEPDGDTDAANKQLNSWDWSVTAAGSAESAYTMGTTLGQAVAAGVTEAAYVGEKEVNNMILVPQATTAATQYTAAEVGSLANGSYIALKVKIMNASDESVIYDDGAGNTAWAMWPVAFDWKPGYRYIYTVDLASGGYYENNQTGEDAELDAILGGESGSAIKFVDVTIDDFVEKKESVPFEPEYVVIGGLKWATMNLGATTVAGSYDTCSGDYYQWGSVNTLYEFITRTVDWRGDTFAVTPLVWKQGKEEGFVANNLEYTGNDSTLPDANDVVKQKIGNGWRMPTKADFEKLLVACGCTDSPIIPTELSSANPGKGIYWLSQQQSYMPDLTGVAGHLFCDGTNKLFLPAAGCGHSHSFYDIGKVGFYLSSNLDTSNPSDSYWLELSISIPDGYHDSYVKIVAFNRVEAPSIRPVSDL